MGILHTLATAARLTTILLIVFPAARAQQPSEYQLKALFIYNFAKFVEWPPDVVSPHGALNICIDGHNNFSSEIEQTVRDKTVNNHPLQIRRLSGKDGAQSCQILLSDGTDLRRDKHLLASISSLPILTVGDSEFFTEAGGMINFAMEGTKVRFDINLEAAERSHLKISSKLLSLARSIKELDKQ